jgi:hypothetical protein
MHSVKLLIWMRREVYEERPIALPDSRLVADLI